MVFLKCQFDLENFSIGPTEKKWIELHQKLLTFCSKSANRTMANSTRMDDINLEFDKTCITSHEGSAVLYTILLGCLSNHWRQTEMLS